MDAEVRRIIEEKNRVEAVKASLERDNNNLKVSEMNFEGCVTVDVCSSFLSFLYSFSYDYNHIQLILI